MSLSPADVGGTLAQEENANPENLQQFTTTERSDLNEANGKDLNYELTPENEIDNQSLTEDLKTNDTLLSRHSVSEGGNVNSFGSIISQEKLRELLYPKKTELTHMKNNTNT